MEISSLIVIVIAGVALAGWGAAWLQNRALQARVAYLIARVVNRQAIEAQLAARQADLSALEALSEVSFNALLLVNPNHQILTLNTAARELFGLPSRGSLSEGTVLSVTRQHEIDDLVAAMLTSDEPEISDQVTLQGRPFRIRALRSGSGPGVRVALALEDVTELQRLGRARRDMVANISHELRTPITSIGLLVDTLLRGVIGDPARAAPLVEKIALENETLKQMAQELLDLAMIESGRAEFRLLPVNLEAITADAIGRLAELAGRKGLTLSSRIPPGVLVLADSEQVIRVLTNLLHNAIKFTAEGGYIAITADPGPEWVTICVADTGPGIPAAERERVFERFYRSDRARMGAGTGLGLAIAKHIIEAHGGHIRADDPPTDPERAGLPPGALVGAYLCFTLPAADS